VVPVNARWQTGVLLLAVLALAACAAPQAKKLLRSPPSDLSPRVELVHVPFFAQEQFQCGPAALATVLSAAGIPTTPESLVPLVYLPARQGSLQVELLAATRRQGALAYQLAPRLDDLLTEVAAGNPVLVLQNLALEWVPRWHYAVVVGYDLMREEIVLRSGTTARAVLSLHTFEHTWNRSKHWAMLALPAGQMPRTAAEVPFVEAALALEQSAQLAAAKSTYSAALERWPNDLTAAIGLGNVAYALGDLVGAKAALLVGAERHPDSVAVLNNLALVLSDLAQHSQALETAQRAATLGGPLHAEAEKTLEKVRAAARR
jgi:tetratricopeptide (TPR) repeat protein